MEPVIGFEETWPVTFANSRSSFDPCLVRCFELFWLQPRDGALRSAHFECFPDVVDIPELSQGKWRGNGRAVWRCLDQSFCF